jgi:cytochrome c553
MIRLVSILAGVALLAPSLLLAQSGDAEAGKGKVVTCVACHGQNGISATPDFPHLAGQVPGYIAAQLDLFKKGADGGRVNAMMNGMVATLTDQDMADIDAYYSALPAPQGSITPEAEELALAGRPIYRAGNAEFSIPACMGCHGPSGKGIAPHYPLLAGQPAEYIRAQLIAYKTGERQNDMMNDIAFPLSGEQIDALATYISGLN